jgi:hypothetical protein
MRFLDASLATTSASFLITKRPVTINQAQQIIVKPTLEEVPKEMDRPD